MTKTKRIRFSWRPCEICGDTMKPEIQTKHGVKYHIYQCKTCGHRHGASAH